MRKRIAIAKVTCAATCAWLVSFNTTAAHDIPDARVDRAIQITLTPRDLKVDYEVSLADLTLAQDLKRLIGKIPEADPAALYKSYGQATAGLNARGFLVSVEGRPIDLTGDSFDVAIEDHPRFLFHFHAAIPESGRLVLRDQNYVSSEGTSRLALRAEGGVRLKAYDGPSSINEIAIVPIWLLSDEEERATREIAVDYSLSPTTERPVASPTTPAAAPRIQDSPNAPPNKLSQLLKRHARTSWAVLWLFALGLGAAHSIQPGHGKTLVAAFALGTRGGWIAGTLLGILTTLVHMSSVVAIAALLWVTRATRYASIDDALRQLSAALIAGAGAYRLGRILGGHSAHADASNATTDLGAGWGALGGLALAGGLLPCWDAVLLIVVAELAGQLPLGIFLLTGFSVGMAGVLVAVGLTAGRLRQKAEGGTNAARWVRAFGILGSLVLLAIGVYLWTA